MIKLLLMEDPSRPGRRTAPACRTSAVRVCHGLPDTVWARAAVEAMPSPPPWAPRQARSVPPPTVVKVIEDVNQEARLPLLPRQPADCGQPSAGEKNQVSQVQRPFPRAGRQGAGSFCEGGR